MSSPTVREFPGLGTPLAFAMPSIVERSDAGPAPRRFTLGADTGRAVHVDPSHRPGSAVDLSTLVRVSEPVEAPVADEAPAEQETAIETHTPAEVAAPEVAAVPTSELTPVDEPVAPPVLPPSAKPVKRFALIDPNQAWVMYVAIVLLGGILTANLASSFTSVYAMAAWVGLPSGVQWLPVVILDVAIVGFSWALMVFASRMADHDLNNENKALVREKTWTTRLWLILVTAYSVVANFLHTYDYWNGDLSTPQAIMGAVFSSSIPLMALVATEELIRLVFIRRKRVNTEGSEL
jgi:hypothetical protein